MIKMSGHKLQNCDGSKPRFEARKMSPMVIIASGQKTFLGMTLLCYTIFIMREKKYFAIAL